MGASVIASVLIVDHEIIENAKTPRHRQTRIRSRRPMPNAIS